MYRTRDGLVSPLLRPRVFFPYPFLSSRLGAFCNDFNVTVFDMTILLFQDNGIYIQSELMDGILPFLRWKRTALRYALFLREYS